ncbi:cytochrome P450 [Phreatobacter stygius]|uniref:Cytochrome P450 n=1 Tax=Phreatobacter stygius TaxID=1940610 RepID=A0A4D7BM88_9HYPH|nr:cytochrome P450 [Phreatobacter stygius]QCI68802.1 cytochrome P450 [Phreatobacter stygius]
MTLVETPRFTPHAIDHPSEPLKALKFLRTLVRNPLETWPRALFEEPVLRLAMAGRPVLFVMDPALVEDVLVARAAIFPKAPIIQRTIGAAVGTKSIFTAEGADWRWQRRASSPPFRHEKILGFVPAMTAAADAAVARLEGQIAGAGAGTPIDMAEAMMATTFDVIVETMLSGKGGFDIERFGAEITHYFDTIGWVAALAVLRLPRWIPYPGKRRARAGNRFLKAEMARVVAERRAHPSVTPDLLDFMIQASDPETGRAMTDAELADNLLTFVVAGHETTALALTWALWLTANSPSVEQRVLDEISSVAGEAPVDAAAADRLVYTKQVIQEAMRLYPPAPLIPRVASEDTVLGTETVKARTPVYVPVYAIHRHAALWTNPDSFDPDRFSAEASKGRPRGAYLPFGAGPRICIGASFAQIEAVVIFATMLRKLKFASVPGHRPKPNTRLTLRPEGGLPMTVARR